MDKLKPCPFCGKEAIVENFSTIAEKTLRYRARCVDGCCYTSWDHFSEDELAEAWNRRVGDV